MTTDPQAQTERELKKPEFQFEIFKLEYEQAAQRYENIYKAIWQIFSYMSALAAAIVAFGANNLPLSTVVYITPLPLLFWLVAIYIPMDFYGQQSRQRLANIEKDINEGFLNYSQKKLKHFSDFQAQRKFNPLKLQWRVRHAILFFALVAAIVWFWLAVTFTNSSQLKPKSSRMEIKLEPPVQIQTQEPQLQELNTELELLSKKLDTIESLIRARNIATPNNNIGKPRQ